MSYVPTDKDHMQFTIHFLSTTTPCPHGTQPDDDFLPATDRLDFAFLPICHTNPSHEPTICSSTLHLLTKLDFHQPSISFYKRFLSGTHKSLSSPPPLIKRHRDKLRLARVAACLAWATVNC